MRSKSYLRILKCRITFRYSSSISKWNKMSGVITTIELINKNVLTFTGVEGRQLRENCERGGTISKLLCFGV